MDGIERLYEGVEVPLPFLRAALSVADTGSRPSLSGVFIHRVGTTIRLVATDGHRMVVASVEIDPETAPAWLREGITISRDGLTRPLGFLASIKSAKAKIAYLEHAGRVMVSDDQDTASFRVERVDGAFPDYGRVLGELDVFEGKELPDMASQAYNPEYLRGIGSIAKLLDVSTVRLHGSVDGEKASLITFPDEPSVVMILMPMKLGHAELAAPTVALLEGPIKGTIAALRAHQTRWAQKAGQAKQARLKKECDDKVAAYEDRINALLARVMPALPAPEVEGPEVEDECAPAHDETGVETLVSDEPAEAEIEALGLSTALEAAE